MTYEQIIKEIGERKFRPIYFLSGEEGYFIDEICSQIENTVLTEDQKAFNQQVMYGKDTEIGAVITAAKRYPMMAPYQVLILKEAQHIRDIEKLSLYAENPLSTTILVICYRDKKLDKRKTLAKKLAKEQVFFESKKLYENQVPAWIDSYLRKNGYSIEIKASSMLVEFLGTVLSKIKNELEKLQIVLPKGTKITPSHIEQNIGISKDFNNFELQNALGCRDISKALQIAMYFENNPNENPFVVTISVLYSFFSTMLLFHYLSKTMDEGSLAKKLGVHPFFLKDYRIASKNYTIKQCVDSITLLREYDMKSKGVGNVGNSAGQLLKELLLKILYS